MVTFCGLSPLYPATSIIFKWRSFYFCRAVSMIWFVLNNAARWGFPPFVLKNIRLFTRSHRFLGFWFNPALVIIIFFFSQKIVIIFFLTSIALICIVKLFYLKKKKKGLKTTIFLLKVMQVGAPLHNLSMAIIPAIRICTSFVMAQWISIVCYCFANQQILRLCLLLPE